MQELECQFKADGGTFEEFRVGDLFEIKTSRGIDEGKLILSEIKKDDFVEFVGRTRENNGIKGYVPFISGISPNDKNVISVSQVGTITAQIRKNQWYASQNIFILKATEERLISFYALCSINKSLSGRFSDGYANYPTLEKLNELKIFLPITSIGEIDFDFMESVIRELQNESIIKLNAFLKSNGLDITELSQEEKDAVLKLRNGDVEWKEFKVGELFENLQAPYLGENPRQENVSRIKTDEFNTPVICAKRGDNGIMYWGREKDFTTYGNVLSVIYNGAIAAGLVYAQKEPIGIYTDSYLIRYKGENVSFRQNLFLKTTLQKVIFEKYTRELKAVWKRITENEIFLPITSDGAIDWDFMQNLITAESRLAIRGVVEWKTKALNTNT